MLAIIGVAEGRGGVVVNGAVVRTEVCFTEVGSGPRSLTTVEEGADVAY